MVVVFIVSSFASFHFFEMVKKYFFSDDFCPYNYLSMQMYLTGNPEYLPEAPHLLNVPKKAMTARCLSILEILQSMTYQYSDSEGAISPVRLLSLLLHRAVKPHLRLSNTEVRYSVLFLFQVLE